jgi:hypothetical protein
LTEAFVASARGAAPLAVRFGGTLTVHSPAGQGTSLLIDLPIGLAGD